MLSALLCSSTIETEARVSSLKVRYEMKKFRRVARGKPFLPISVNESQFENSQARMFLPGFFKLDFY